MSELFSEYELKQYIDENLSFSKIAKNKGCSISTVSRYMKKYNLSTRGRKDYIDKCRYCGKELIGLQMQFCSKECKIKHYSESPKNRNKKCHFQTQRGLNRKRMMVDYAGGCCQKCGYKKNYAALTFHHNNIKDKSFNLNTRNASSKSLEDLFKEVDKCTLLCHNCHNELHYPQLDYETLKKNDFIIS